MKLSKYDFEKIINQVTANPNERIPACGYCRFSSDRQKEESIEAQQRAITEHAERNGYVIVDWYIDRAFSGKTVNRPAFQKLLTDITADDCPFSVVLIHKMDRFSRNAADALKYKDILHDYGVELISTVERIKDDANGRLLYGIMSNINQYYIDNLSNEVMKGMRENALQKKWNGGKPPLGYDVVNKQLTINEAEAVIIRKIFEMAAEGNGYNTIIKELNACGYKTKAGNPFGKNSLYDLLQNERYKGVYLFNKRSKRNSQNKRNGRKLKAESDMIRFEDGCPAIVSKELWERANASRRMMASISTNAKTVYLLSGLLYCGECGAKMHGNHRHTGNGKYIYNTYRCNKQANQMTCACKEIRSEDLDEFVIDALTEHFFNSEIIDYITDEVNAKIQESLAAEQEDIQHAKNALSGLKLARNNLVEAVAQTGFNPTLAEKLESIEKQIAEHEALIQAAEAEKTEIKITREEVQEKINALKKEMLNPKNVKQTKLLLRSYIEKIVVDNNTVKVTLRVTFSFYYRDELYEVSYTHVIVEIRDGVRLPSASKKHGRLSETLEKRIQM